MRYVSGKKRTVITEGDVLKAVRKGMRELYLPPGAIITPLARDTARQKDVHFLIETTGDPGENLLAVPNPANRIALGSDHHGFFLKKTVSDFLMESGYTVIDVGCNASDPCDYPVFAFAVASLISNGKADFGTMIDGTGIGSAMVANKVRNIRAANGSDILTARFAREYYDCNMLTLSGMLLGETTVLEVVKMFLKTSFESRHKPRVGMIRDIETRWGSAETE